MKPFVLILFLGIFAVVGPSLFVGLAYADNPNLFVSVENRKFENHFAGSMIVEVVVNDPNLKDRDQGLGEPDVTLNGKSLRMAQATDGSWYAYFANVNKAKVADQIAFESGTGGVGLDFGVFCDRDTDPSVVGISLSETDGFAVPDSQGLSGFTQGTAKFSECTGSPASSSSDLNNIVRKAKFLNSNSNVASGQIGLDPNAWPLVQLFSFDDVTIVYNPGGPAQTVHLEYDEIKNISISKDRDFYPANSEVFITIHDMQLNQDPTDADSWTFAVGPNSSVFYQAFDSNGRESAAGSPGLVDLSPRLSSLGFEDNGLFSMNFDSIVAFRTNDYQPALSISDGSESFSNIVTFVETEPNSGIFASYDNSDRSVIGILPNASRGLSDSVTYNEDSLSLLSGSSTARIEADPVLSVDASSSWRPGTEIPVRLYDPDQNLNSDSQDDLDLFRSTALIPTLKVGSPITLGSAGSVLLYETSTTSSNSGIAVPSSVPDSNSARLFLNTGLVNDTDFEKISIRLGVLASDLREILVNQKTDLGTNWINYDIRSLNRELELNDLSDTSFSLHFGSIDSPPVVIADKGSLRSFQGTVLLDGVDELQTKSGQVFLVMNFDASDDSSSAATILNEDDSQPIVFDIFSFGIKEDGKDVNNAIYRLELEESSDDSGLFVGSLEYGVANQLNIASASIADLLRPIDEEVKFLVTDRLVDEEGVSISYSDVANVGLSIPISTKSDIRTSSGMVSTDSRTYGFGRPVTIVLNDPDLNLRGDIVDIYHVINDPNSVNIDAVGTQSGDVLLEVIIKGTKYKRCVIDGVEHGGLGSTGFTLVETSPSSGTFEGVFKMPSQICNKSGTELMYTSGGNIDVRYFDFRDARGEKNIVTLSREKSYEFSAGNASLNSDRFELPSYPNSTEVVLTGSITGHNRGVPAEIILTLPDQSQQNFAVYPTNSGKYRAIFSLGHDSMVGTYHVDVLYRSSNISTTSFVIESNQLMDDFKDTAASWSNDGISDGAFLDNIRNLETKNYFDVPFMKGLSPHDESVPDWMKNTARWWSDDLISQDEYMQSIEFLVKKGILRI